MSCDNDLGPMYGGDMGISRRLYGDVVEWIWGLEGMKWRSFGDVAEWIWATGLVRWSIEGKWTASDCLNGE